MFLIRINDMFCTFLIRINDMFCAFVSHRHHQIGIPLSGMGALHAEGLKCLPHLTGIAGAEGCRELLLQAAEDFGGSHQSSFLLVGWQAEALVENLLDGRLLVEGTVVRLYLLLFLRGKPITFTIQ